MTVQSCLARYVPRAATSEGHLLAMGARAYHEQDTLVVRLGTIDDPMIRQMAVAVGDYVFGQKREPGSAN